MPVKASALCASALILGSVMGALQAQDPTPLPTAIPSPTATPPPNQPGGLQIRTISANAAYYSNGAPTTGGTVQPGTANLASDASFGGSAQVDWTKFTDRSSMSLTYSPSYIGRVRYSSINALNHNFSFNTNRKVVPRWNLGFSVTADLSSIQQTLFSPTTLSNVASVPSNFDDLAAALLAAKFTNPELAAILTSAPLAQSPLSNLLYGERMLTASAQTTLGYSYSPRLSFTFTTGASRSQHVSDNQGAIAQNSYLLANTTSGRASMTISYSLSPLTQIDGSLTTSRVSSSLMDTYTTTSLITLGRTLERRWLVQVRGGVGVTNVLRQTLSLVQPTTPRPAIGGTLGFKTFSHTLLSSYDLTVSDSYGLGASTSSSANISWRWDRPGSSWWLENSFGWQQLKSNALSDISISGWHATAAIGRRLGVHFSLRTEYSYLTSSGALQVVAYNLAQSAARVSVVWNAQASQAH
jgi:hypothetical protein